MHTQIDHLVVTAATLSEGADFVQACLGLRPVPGGKHPRMATHNLLLRLGDAMYLEVIAPDPEAEAPERPRWFDLDHQHNAPPRLATWVARCSDIVGVSRQTSQSLGEVETMTRGHLSWQIGIPHDGRLVLEGLAPSLIQWGASEHPAASMPDHGCSLSTLDICHADPAPLETLLKSIHFEGPLRLTAAQNKGAAYLLAHINTPQGPRQLGGPAAPS